MNAMNSSNIASMIATATAAPVQPEVMRLVEHAIEKFSPAVRAVLFYGSCRRDTTLSGLVDLYVIVDAYTGLPVRDRWLARLIPPNVYYIEMPAFVPPAEVPPAEVPPAEVPPAEVEPVEVLAQTGQKLRCKCTVISSRDFANGASRWFHPYIWGRFAQPVTIAYSASADDRRAVVAALAGALRKLITATLPLMPDRFTAKQLWCRGLARSFGTELRAESAQRARHIYISDREYYNHATTLLIGSAEGGTELVNPTGQATRRLGPLTWQLRGMTGKTFSVVRVLKGALTFNNGLDYVVWKLERHSGQPINVPERVRRHPTIFLIPFFVHLYRRGIFH